MAARPQPEARSLSALNYLAANPPQYPYSPELRESLTLYISRVPGTQDIILSTLRPQRKSVTGEDITNSLYYVHLDSPEDVLLKAAQPPEGVISPRSSGESARSAIPRKPLPVSARGPRPETGMMNGAVPASLSVLTGPVRQTPSPRNTAPPPVSELQPVEGGAVEGYRVNPMFQKRRPGNPPDLRTSTASPAPSAASFQRKALNPRSPSPMFGSDGTPQPQFNARPPGRPVTPTHPSLAPHPNGQTEYIAPPTSPLYRDRTPSPGPVGRPASSITFSLTIIRRDPTSGAQYNIGKVSSFQTNVPTPDSADPNLDPDNMGGLLAQAQKIDIRLDSSGYAKYRGLPNRAELDALRPTSGQSFTQQMMQGTGPGQGGGRGAAVKPAWRPVEEGFSRQVVMSYGASWKANFKKAFHRRDRSGSQGNAGNVSPDTAGAPRPFHARHGSASTIGSVDSADGGVSPTLITHPGPGLKPRGYVFLSPWDGRCEFRTSTNGRSLKCRHILDAASMRIDAREVAQSIQNAQAMGRSRGDELSSALVGAKPVSELRFNLPQGALHKANAGGQSKGGLSVQFSKLLQHQSRSSEDESDYDDFVDYNDTPLDLSLGKENAGGGNRGKRAKLGKLIIHDEGLKMLDLVVAANVGVWWNSWSRMV